MIVNTNYVDPNAGGGLTFNVASQFANDDQINAVIPINSPFNFQQTGSVRFCRPFDNPTKSIGLAAITTDYRTSPFDSTTKGNEISFVAVEIDWDNQTMQCSVSDKQFLFSNNGRTFTLQWLSLGSSWSDYSQVYGIVLPSA